MCFFVNPRRGENEEEDKTKSLSVNPFRSWGFPWLGQKGATCGDPKRKRGEPITFLTLHNHLSSGELLHQCASQYDPTQQWVLQLLHQQQLLGHSSSAESGSRGPLVLTELQWIASVCTRGEVHIVCMSYTPVWEQSYCFQKCLTHAVNIITYTLHSVVGYYLPSTRLPHLNNTLRMVNLRAVDTFLLHFKQSGK